MGDNRRTQLPLWVSEEGGIEFIMGSERDVGVIPAAGLFPEGVWTHLVVSVEGRKVSCERYFRHALEGEGINFCSYVHPVPRAD